MEAVYFLIHVIKHIIRLSFSQKPLPLQCVFHSIRFKVNKGWSSAELLFLCPFPYGILVFFLIPKNALAFAFKLLYVLIRTPLRFNSNVLTFFPERAYVFLRLNMYQKIPPFPLEWSVSPYTRTHTRTHGLYNVVHFTHNFSHK